MSIYQVNVSEVLCADFEVEADRAEEAKKMALRRDGVTVSGDWCEGHRETRVVNTVELIEDEG